MTDSLNPSGKGVPRLPTGLTLAIGSMPHQDPDRAVDLLVEACPEAPCWPQLPSLGFQENMIPQFSEGVPCVELALDDRKIVFTQSKNRDAELANFYENCFAAEESGDFDEFACSPSFAKGFYAFLEKSAAEPPGSRGFIKGQITGPLTFGLSIMDENGVPALFNDTLSDVIRKSIPMKSRWQINRLKPLGQTSILFVDEPILASYGSAAFVSLSREQAVSILEESFSAVKEAGCLVGSHCCANTDWSLMVDAGVDIINFDAYSYTDSIGLYAESITRFLEDGGYLAWGIVPSQSLGERPSPEDLFKMLEQGIEQLTSRGIPREGLQRNLILTTSCGLGTLSEETAERALRELKELGRLTRERFGTT